jgi:hypothetical protein
MTWDANFTDLLGTPALTTGNYITMAGNVPLVQDVALVSLRTQLVGNTMGAVELPGLILAVERTGPATYAALALQDNGIGGVTPLPGGWAVLIDNPVTGAFRALAYNLLTDLPSAGDPMGLDGLSIPAGELLTARVTATVYSDPSDLSMFDPLLHPDLLAAAALAGGGTPFPAQPLFGFTDIPEPSTICLAIAGLLMVARRRRAVR